MQEKNEMKTLKQTKNNIREVIKHAHDLFLLSFKTVYYFKSFFVEKMGALAQRKKARDLARETVCVLAI